MLAVVIKVAVLWNRVPVLWNRVPVLSGFTIIISKILCFGKRTKIIHVNNHGMKEASAGFESDTINSF